MNLQDELLSNINKKDPQGIRQNGMPYRILIADDSSVMRKLVSQILKSEMYEICGEAANGYEALEMYERLKPDLLTLDINMPLMDGMTALKQLLATDKNARVVMLTSDAEQQAVVQAVQIGAKNYVVKPPVRNVLLEKIQASLA